MTCLFAVTVFTHQNVPGTRAESVDATSVIQVGVAFTYSMVYFVGEAAAMDLVTEIRREPVPLFFRNW